jgi:hypothetical protein
MAEDLARWQAGEPILAKPAPLPRRWWRKVRRHPLISGAAVAFVLIATAAAGAWYATDPDRGLRAMQNDLIRGKPAVVIAETGRPRWSQWQSGEAGTGVNARDGCFYIQTNEFSLLEIMSDPKVPSYRFRAELRHDSDPSHQGEVGIYFSHEKLIGTNGPAHSFLALRLADSPNSLHVAKDAKGQDFHRVALEYRYYREPDVGRGLNLRSLITKIGQAAVYDFLVPEKQPDQPPWHPLAVEVEPNQVRVYWNYLLFAVMPRGDLENCANISLGLCAETEDLRFRFNPRTALGLYVVQSTVSFRNVVIEPLPVGK